MTNAQFEHVHDILNLDTIESKPLSCNRLKGHTAERYSVQNDVYGECSIQSVSFPFSVTTEG